METSLPELEAHPGDCQQRSPARGNTADSEPSLFDFLVILVERRKVVGWVTALALMAGAVVALILPNKYSAVVTLLPPQQSSSVAATIASQLGNLGGMAALAGGNLGLKNTNDLYVAMLKSRTVEDAMIQRFDLLKDYRVKRMSDGRKRLEKYTAIDSGIKDGLIHVTVVDRDPHRAAELANGYVDQFRRLSEHLAITEAAQRRLFFEQQLEQAKNHLASSEESLKETEQKTGLIQLDSQARALIEFAGTLRGQIAAKEVQIQSLQTFATSENSQLVLAEQELAALRAQLARLGGSEAGADAGLIVPKGKVPEAGLQYVRKLRDVRYYETIFEIIARQFELAKLDEAKQGAVIQVVDAAVPPDKKSFPPRVLIVLGATVVGLIVAVFTVALQDSWRRVQADPEASARISRMQSSWSGKDRRAKGSAQVVDDAN